MDSAVSVFGIVQEDFTVVTEGERLGSPVWKCRGCGSKTALCHGSGYSKGERVAKGVMCDTGDCYEGMVPTSDEPGPTESILEEAQRLTGNGGERNDSYDHPYPNFTKIGQAWSLLFGVPVSPRQVALAMILMKAIRDNHRGKRDNIVDIAGYARCIERLDEWKEPTTDGA